MNSRNNKGLYDAPNFLAVQGPIVLSQTELEQQLADKAFVMDREEALSCGLINPYADDTAKVQVQ